MDSVRSVSMATSTAAGSDAFSCGSTRLMRSTTSMTLAPGWRWMLTMIAAESLPRGEARVLGSVGDFGHVTRRTAAPLR